MTIFVPYPVRLEKLPLREPQVKISKLLPVTGVKLLINWMSRVPSSAAAPVTVSRSCWVSAVRPPISTFNLPPELCV